MKKFILLLLILIAATVWEVQKWVKNAGPLDEVVNVIIPKGASSRLVAERLEQVGVIDKPWLFMIIGRLKGLDKKLRAGEYQFMPEASLQEVMEKISKGEVFYRRLTIPEGYNTGKILYMLASHPELSGEVPEYVAEGELLPETYTYEYGASRESLVLQARLAMAKVIDEAWESREDGLPLKNKEEMLVLASIIEKETAVADERPLVASVFVNRLRKGMKLQTDPTVIYALTEGLSELGRPLKKSDLNIDSPYNTYKYYGLPPKPICNPGKDAIMAAVHPAKSNYLYFVADGNGGHNFAKNLSEHNTNVRSWIKKLK